MAAVEARFFAQPDKMVGMRRIAIFSHACVVSANRELFQELSRSYDLLLVCPSHWKGSLISELKASQDAGIQAYPVANSGNGSLFFYKSRFPEVHAFAPDLIFLDEEPWSLVALQVYLAFPHVKKVFYTKQNLKKPVPAPFSWIQRHVFRRSVGAFVISEEAKAVLRWKNYLGAPEVLPHSMNQGKFRPLNAAEKQATRARFQLPENKFLAGYFGRLTSEKGINDLLGAAHELMSTSHNLGFVFVGNGPFQAEIQAAAARFPGRIFSFSALPHEQVHALMACMDLTVLPSRTTPRWKEQFGRVIIESAACGVPVVGSDSGEIPHLIERARCGLSYPEGDVSALSSAVKSVFEDEVLFRKFCSEGSLEARSKFSHEAVAAQLSAQLADFSSRFATRA